MKLKEFMDRFLLNEKVTFRGSIEELKNRLNEPKKRDYRVEWLSESEFKFISKWSVGTWDGIGDNNGIKGYAKISEGENSNFITIELTTIVRAEFYFITGIFLLFFLSQLFTDKILPIWLYLLYPIFIGWFGFVFQAQEKQLFKKVKKHLSQNPFD